MEVMFGWIARLSRQPRDEASHIEFQLPQSYGTAVIHFLYRMLQDRAVAEELAVEVFLRLYRSSAGSSDRSDIIAQLFRVATDLALSGLRNSNSQSIREQSVDSLGSARRAVALLPGKQRAAVLLHKYHHMGYRQIAQVLNCRESAARSLLCAAYATLRRRLAAADRKLTGLSSESTRFQNELDPLQQIG